MKINSHNEWSKLREVVVGKGDGYSSLMFRNGLPDVDTLKTAVNFAKEAYPQWLVDEVNEDLEGLCDVLKPFGVKVYRPDLSHNNELFSTPYFSAIGGHVYNVRDLHLVVGNTVVESPSQERCRYFETMGLYHIWYQYLQEGFRWVVGPKPKLAGDDHMVVYFKDGTDQYPDGQKFTKLTEDEILFEAANTARLGKDLLYLVSRSGNYLGAKWLQNVLGDDYRVHATDRIYRSSHIDSTVMALRPGLVLLNSTRVNQKDCPAIFEKWDKIYFDDIVFTPDRVTEYQKKVRRPIYNKLTELGVKSDLDSIASPWIGMNFLSIDTEHIIVDRIQIPLMRLLEKHGIIPVPIPFRHSYLMGGGIHCSTLDTVRDSKLESYCD